MSASNSTENDMGGEPGQEEASFQPPDFVKGNSDTGSESNGDSEGVMSSLTTSSRQQDSGENNSNDSGSDYSWSGDRKRKATVDDEDEAPIVTSSEPTDSSGTDSKGKGATSSSDIEAKREYNRRNAARARKRHKEVVNDLQEKVQQLTDHTEELEHKNHLLRAQLDILQQQNHTLRDTSQPAPDVQAQQLLQQHGNNQNQQQVLEWLQSLPPEMVYSLIRRNNSNSG